jgi:hypothetical protein
MIRTQIQLTEDQWKKLKELSAMRRTPVAELVRASIDQYIGSSEIITMDERRRRAIAVIGRYHSGETGGNISEEHDKYLDEAYGTW